MEQTEKIINYQNINYRDIAKVVNIKPVYSETKFNNWFLYKYKISTSEETFLKNLIEKNKANLSIYNEAKLLVRFISQVLMKVDFDTGEIKDWYNDLLSGEVNGYKFSGRTDFMVAKGEAYPEKPYFFIQEFKRTTPHNNPLYQLLAEMIVALEINKTNIMHGGYIYGKHWEFVILEKLETTIPNKKQEVRYEYFTSKSFNCLDIDHLKQIYINLQAAKALFCKD